MPFVLLVAEIHNEQCLTVCVQVAFGSLYRNGFETVLLPLVAVAVAVAATILGGGVVRLDESDSTSMTSGLIWIEASSWPIGASEM